MQYPPWPVLLARWQAYEEMGFDSIWVCDHFVSANGQRALFEAWTLLAALAAQTRRIRFGTAVTCMAFRHPAILAKEAITLDHISGGRVEIGLGAGWWAAEHAMYGFDFLSPPARVARFRETVEILDRLLRHEVTTYAGKTFQLRGAPSRPQPQQQPRPPLALAAQGPKMLDVVAAYADRWMVSFGLGVDEISERNALLDERCAALGRDPRQVRRIFLWAPWVQAADPWSSPAAFAGFVNRYRAAGITDFIFDEPQREQYPILERVARETLPRLRTGNGTDRFSFT